MNKALGWSVSICTLAGSLALAVPGTASAAPGPGPGVMALAPAFGGRLYGVSTPSGGDVWAVGLNAWAVGQFNAADGSYRTLALHWDGRHWSVVPTQSPGGDGAFLSVTAAWTNNIWAVGIRNPTLCSNGGPQCKTLVEHWNGSHWTLLASPNPPSGYLNVLFGVRAASRTSIFAVGSTDYGSTLIIHWNGKAWS